MPNLFIQKYGPLLPKTVSLLGSFSLLLGSFLFLNTPTSVQAAQVFGDLNNVPRGEVRQLNIEYSAEDFTVDPDTGSIVSPEIRVQIDNSSLEFVDYSTNESSCFDEANNQAYLGMECLQESFAGSFSPAITNSQEILKTGNGPTSGSLAGTANNTTVLSYCPLSSRTETQQYKIGGSTVSVQNPSEAPSLNSTCSLANIPAGQTGNLTFKVRVKDLATDLSNAVRVILRSYNGNPPNANTDPSGYDLNGWGDVFISNTNLIVEDFGERPLIINEINWAGSSTSANDQWIELYNTTEVEISLEGYTIADLTLNAETCGSAPIIPARGYFLLSKLAHTDPASLLNVQSDCVAPGLNLATTGQELILQSGADVADQTPVGIWAAGDNAMGSCNNPTNGEVCTSMIRNPLSYTYTGVDPSDWQSSLLVLNEDTGLQNPGASIIAGRKTPKAVNQVIDETGSGAYEAESLKINAGIIVSNSAESLNEVGTSIKAPAGTFGYVAYGPYTTELTPGATYKASFKMAVSDNTNPNLAFGIDAFSDMGPLAHTHLMATQFSTARTFQDFDLTFIAPSSKVEFRLSASGLGPDLFLDKITVTPSAPQAQVYEAENMLRPMASTILGCNNTCVQNSPTLQDWLIFGPYSRADLAGSRNAKFKMKIDNNTAGEEAVIITIRNASTGVYETAKKVYPSEFTANDTFQDFALPFNKVDQNHVYEYAAYYDNSWSGRTVSIDKITVE